MRGMFTKDTKVIKIQKKYLEGFLNKEFPKEAIDQVKWNSGVVDLIKEEEMRSVVKKMKNRKSQDQMMYQ